MIFEQRVDRLLSEEQRRPYFRCSNPGDDNYTLVTPSHAPVEEVEAFLRSKYQDVLWRPEDLPLWRLYACDGKRIWVPDEWPTHYWPA